MRLLARIQARNEAWLQKLDGGRFRGAFHPVDKTSLSTSAFIASRQMLRVRPEEPVRAGDLFRDTVGRVFLIGNYDPAAHTRLHACFLLDRHVSWKRASETLHPITRQPVSTEVKEIGPIWASIENYTRADNDPGLRFQVDRLRVVTNAELQLNDRVDGKTVKRLVPSLGVMIAEIE